MHGSQLKIKATRQRRRAWTFVELLTTLAILSALVGAVAFGGRLVINSRRLASAKAQIKLIAAAIDQYAAFWPQWKVGTTVVAEKGWPDFVPGRLFANCTSGFGPYQEVAGFNDFVEFLAGPAWIDSMGDVLQGNTCMVFGLRAASGKGPFVKDAGGFNLVTGEKFAGVASNILYPGFCPSGGAKPTELMVDPWGNPLRYFWVYRDASRNSHRGYMPVDFAPLEDGPGAVGAQSASFEQPASAGARQVAVGYVLESAGPDGKFGNVWKISPTQPEIDEAADNLVISP